jgi:predicted phosphohydrolase
MKILCISDTHGRHDALQLPPADMIIHAGDFSAFGQKDDAHRFLDWFSRLPYRHKVFIAGNHDFLAESNPERFARLVPDNCIYLNDSGATVAGIRIWGSPITPLFHHWAFNRRRGPEIRQHWNLIPDEVDILVTHGPPLGMLDRIVRGDRAGCADLLERVQQVKPRLHLFGHIHEDYGIRAAEDTTFINASCLNAYGQLTNTPVVIDWKPVPLAFT